MHPNVAATVRLMLVTDDALLAGRDLVATVLAAVRGGATSVQLRLKQATPRELADAARALLAAVPVPLLVNDRADVAIAVGAAGVHLGPDDVPVAIIRGIAPPGFLIGASVGSPREADGGRGADYWGVGPWNATSTKGDAGAAIGAEGFQRVVRLAEGKPCIAIGGVRTEDVPGVLGARGAGVAVVSGILAGEDSEVRTRAYAIQVARWRAGQMAR
jgi:thiamine-phosphate pyrophosphorylase